MIREYRPADVTKILDIWLEASIKAHSFVAQEFWASQVANMRDIYFPASKVFVYESDSNVIGFYALYESTLAAIFVEPKCQGRGVGKQLVDHAKSVCSELTLSVYKENQASIQFYLSQGFKIVNEQADEHTGHQQYTMSVNA